MRRHHYHSSLKRGVWSLLLVGSVVAAGTLGMHRIERLSWVDAFYFMSMIATAQGPAVAPATAAGKLFVSLIAFVSVGCVVASLGFLFGPFFGQLWRVGVDCGVPLTALVTRPAIATLALAQGVPVEVTFKATAVHLVRRGASGPS